jgi:hypothetical protein
VTIVVGSSWPKDEDFIELHKSTALNVKFIIAYNIKDEQIQNSKQHQPKTVLFSEKKK